MTDRLRKLYDLEARLAAEVETMARGLCDPCKACGTPPIVHASPFERLGEFRWQIAHPMGNCRYRRRYAVAGSAAAAVNGWNMGNADATT